MKAEGRTILFVTHDMGSVERFCDRGLVLERGRVVDMGHPEQITRTYSELNFGQLGGTEEDQGPVRILSAWCEDPGGERIVASPQGDRVVACFELEFAEQVTDPLLSVVFRNDVRHTIFVASSKVLGEPTGTFAAGERCTVRFSFDNRLAPSRYTLTPAVGARGRGQDAYARADDLSALLVQAPHWTGGVVDLPYEMEVRRA
jgi:hypothetical protein